MKITVKFYSYLETAFGRKSMEVEIKKNTTLDELLAELSSNWDNNTRKVLGGAKRGFNILPIVNDSFSSLDYCLAEGDKVSLLIPIDGG